MSDRHLMRASFEGTGGSLFGIQFVNLLLTMVTFGIYSFWGRTRVRRYLWSQTEFDGDRFAYHGTGGELLRGYLLGMLLFGGLYVIFAILGAVLPVESNPITALAFGMTGSVVFATLIGVAKVGARRYRLSRSSWRGVRFSFRGHVGEFLGIFVPGVLLSALTLGVYVPFFQCRQREFFAERTRFGSGAFAFDGKGKDLIGPYLMALVLMLPTLGLYWFWYAAYRDRYYWDHTYFEDAQFRSTVTGGAMLGLAVTNLLLVAVTFGLAMPWAVVRVRRFVAERVMLDGDVDLSAIVEDAQRAGPTGEGMSDMLDMGGLELGGGF